ncbi:Rad52/Rad22 family DNA repair protein [Edaphobacter dinghuensis]|uniref:Rad52/22 family double-strand break repair protein n=1 Tax=Edaphobacter dinghuensis TaxID=1560005 RepID=A0A917HQ79_9BACT|nr:Rad52/Rad22 family DNA repair protein [Edaphobacter dinghuensis]GGG87075.1 hypothetical protein GCM10011585_33860 [Edaphobacter dinghuensis]
METRGGRLTAEERRSLEEKLSQPFPPEIIRWLVEERTPDRSKGKLLAYVDPRAYTDRLNEVVGPSGWHDRYSVNAISGVPRPERGGTVQSGKIFVLCHLTIHGFGTKPGTGERWADEKNALARAESQALRRACSRFGLGRYLYSLGEAWVRLDGAGSPVSVPELPQWALPGTSRIVVPSASVSTQSTPRNFLDTRITSRIESFKSCLGEPIYLEILHRVGQCQSARAILTRDCQTEVLRWMEAAARRANRIKTLTRVLGTAQLMEEMGDLQITSGMSIPSLQALTELLENMESIAQQHAA